MYGRIKGEWKMSFETKCYFLHGCKWEKKDGKRHNNCQAPDTEPCKYKYLSEKPKTQTEKIAEALAARDKEWVEWASGKCDKHIVYKPFDSQYHYQDKGTYFWSHRNDCFECWQSRRKEIGI
jgi:hypothetical protein